MCSNPKSFKNDPRRKDYRTVASKIAYGLNLDGTTDGRATPKTCGHQKFQGQSGEPLVDNQFYRVAGCSKLTRGTERQTRNSMGYFIVELRGVDRRVHGNLHGTERRGDPGVHRVFAR